MTAEAPPDLTILLPSLAGGGAERAMVNLAGELARRGRRVGLALFRPGGALSDAVPANVTVHVLGARRAATAGPAVARHLDRHRPRVLLSSMLHTGMAASAGVALSRHRPRLVWSLQNLPQAELAATPWPRSALLRLALRVAVRSPERIVAVSRGVGAAFASLVPDAAERIVAVYNPVIDPARIRLRLPRPVGAPPRLIAIGRLVPQKNYPLLLRAFAVVRAAGDGQGGAPDAHLTILGEGPLRPALEAEAARLGIADAVAMPGFVPDTAEEMARADVFVMSSSYEGLANVIPEAMAAGLPVVSTDWPPAAREVLEDGRWGRLVPLEDPEALAAAILSTLADGGIDARERAREFEIGRCTDAYEAVLFPDG